LLPFFGTYAWFCAYFLSIRFQRTTRTTRIWFYMIHTASICYYFPGCNLHILRS
jgi:hypothetical protein